MFDRIATWFASIPPQPVRVVRSARVVARAAVCPAADTGTPAVSTAGSAAFAGDWAWCSGVACPCPNHSVLLLIARRRRRPLKGGAVPVHFELSICCQVVRWRI